MRHRRAVLGLTVTLVILAALGGAGLTWFRYAPRRTPQGQPTLSRLDAATLPAFRDDFNARVGKTRVLVLLSPT